MMPGPDPVLGQRCADGLSRRVVELWSRVGDIERRGWRIVGVTSLHISKEGVIHNNREYCCFAAPAQGS